MSLFLKCKAGGEDLANAGAGTGVSTQTSPPDGLPIKTVWRRGAGRRALLAVQYGGGEVRVYDESGTEEPTKALQRVRGTASCIAWHPTAPILAVGWINGSVTIWKHAEGRTETTDCLKSCKTANLDLSLPDSDDNSSGITCVEWGFGGSRLATGTASGLASIWKVDAGGRLNHLTTIVSKGNTILKAFALMKGKRQQNDAQISFLFETDNQGRHSSPVRGKEGEIFMLNEAGHREFVCKTDSPLSMLSFASRREAVVALSTAGTLSVLVHQQQKGKWLSAAHLRLAAAVNSGSRDQKKNLFAKMCTDDIIAFASSNDEFVRIYNIDSEENSLLQLHGERLDDDSVEKDTITSLSYDDTSGLLAAGTSKGRVMMWRLNARQEKEEEADTSIKEDGSDVTTGGLWEPLPLIKADSEILSMASSEGMRSLSACTRSSVTIFRKYQLSRSACAQVTAVQVDPSEVAIGIKNSDPIILKTTFQVYALRVTNTHIMIFGEHLVEVYEVNGLEVSIIGSFENALVGKKVSIGHYQNSATMRYTSDFSARQLENISAYADNIFRISSEDTGCIEVCNASGVVKQSLSCEQTFGAPTSISAHSCHTGNSNGFLVGSMSGSYVMLWRLGGREAKKVFAQPRRVEPKGRLGQVLSVRCNCNGTKISILRESEDNRQTDSRLLIYDVDSDVTFEYDFGVDDMTPENHLWDTEDPRLLACEAFMNSCPGKHNLYTLFATQDQGILLQEKYALDHGVGLLSLQAPFVNLFLSPTSSQKVNDIPNRNDIESRYSNSVGRTTKITLRDFKGMENVDETTRKALLDFSYSLATGSMEDAQRSVKMVTNANVWSNMAMMCIKTKRLSFAEYCLGRMGHARGARAVRETNGMKEEDARVGYAALHLNMKEDALQLFRECGRYDLVNKLYQASGEWEKAIQTASTHDRIHLKNTHYAYARHLEDCNDIQGAMREYEIAATHTSEIPRMTYEMNKVETLEQYTAVKHVKQHIVWLARNAESNGKLNEAVQLYQNADDSISLVRLYCVQENYDAAEQVVNESESKAAAFQLARQYENIENIPKAIKYYSKSGRLSSAIRLAKRYEMGSELLSLSLQTTPLLALEAADWLESDGQYEHAVTLYQKFGRRSKALSLCFEKELFDSLRAMADELGTGDDPAMLQRCANFFTSHGQYEKAVHLFISAKEYNEALELCIAHNVNITEEMADKMTPEKGSVSDEIRITLLKRIAKVCKSQGQFQVACKKFTQAGERHKAMKVLLKSGDTEKIMFFAQVSRQRELYVMAANYLQTMDWHSNSEIMKAVVQFYTKARAMESLCSFYESCAQFEVDEFRDYEKAIAALREATNAMNKSQANDKTERLLDLDRRIEFIKTFLEARSHSKDDPNKMIEMCSMLINRIPVGDGGMGLRVGDIFALMIEYHYSIRNMREAFQLIQEMKKRGIDRAPYLGSDIIEAIYDNIGDEMNARGDHEEEVLDDYHEDHRSTHERMDSEIDSDEIGEEIDL